MNILGVAISNWDGNRRTHLYEKGQHVLQVKTVCGRSALGWEKEDFVGQPISCKACDRKRPL